MIEEQLRRYIQTNPDVARALAEQLHDKATAVVIPEWQEAFRQLTREDCIAYVHYLTISRTYGVYTRPKLVIHDGVAIIFPAIRFEETYDALYEIGTDFTNDIGYLIDVDYLGFVGEKAFGIQVKPTTANRATDHTNFSNYDVSERTKASFSEFQDDFSGKVFIVFSLDGEIGNPGIIQEIAAEVTRLQA